MDSAFMNDVAAGVARGGIRVVRFEFPYMAKRRQDGRKRPPDRQPVLLDAWRDIARRFAHERLVIGGKSMGGRMASLVADELGVQGLICLGYPFHPPGRPEKTRVDHLTNLRTPTLILQGERDSFGTRSEVDAYALSPSISVVFLTDGDHGFKPRKASGVSEPENIEQAAEAMVEFCRGLS